jgi:hypothetical protein
VDGMVGLRFEVLWGVQQTHSKNNLLFQNIGNVINNIYNYSNIIMHKTVHQNNYIIQRKCFFLNL